MNTSVSIIWPSLTKRVLSNRSVIFRDSNTWEGCFIYAAKVNPSPVNIFFDF